MVEVLVAEVDKIRERAEVLIECREGGRAECFLDGTIDEGGVAVRKFLEFGFV